MERWNDKLRPLSFYEIDKQSHKMIIAYFLGHFEEDNPDFDWIEIIEGGIFELLQRMVITDIKPSVLRKIAEDKEKYIEFNNWIYKQLENDILILGEDFCQRFKKFFNDRDSNNINKKILKAAHLYSSKWEFDIIERATPDGYDIDLIKKEFEDTMEEFYDLEGIKQLALYKSYRKFIDLCGQLRFQIRWANLHRIPKTSVLGHSFFVATVTFLFSLLNGFCKKRMFNNYFTGLFHDLPEVLTRDIISPVKKSVEGLSEIIKNYEIEQMNNIVYPLVPKKIKEELKFFTEEEFENFIYKDDNKLNLGIKEIIQSYNYDSFNPKDGIIVKAVDELSAFIEALTAIENGSNSIEFQDATKNLKNKYSVSKDIYNISFSKLFGEF